MSTILVMKIDKGKDYIRCDDMVDAVRRIRKDFNNFLCLLPELKLDGITTGEAFVNKIEEAMLAGKCMKKRAFLAAIGGAPNGE